MGAEGWMLAASTKEAEKIKAYLAPTDGGMGKEDEYGCWFQWTGKLRLEIGRTSYHLNSVCEAFIRRELARRFNFRRIGSDATGWYPDSDLASEDCIEKYGEWDSWVEWAKNYCIEWDFWYRGIQRIIERGEPDAVALAEGEMRPLREIEAWVVEQFEALDEKAGMTHDLPTV